MTEIETIVSEAVGDDFANRIEELAAAATAAKPTVPFEKLDLARDKLGVSVGLACAAIGASRQSYYHWRVRSDGKQLKPSKLYHARLEQLMRTLLRAVDAGEWPCATIQSLKGDEQVAAFNALIARFS